MKKKAFLIVAMAIIGFGVFVMSCTKTTCTCTETDYAGYTATRELDPASFGATNCSDLTVKLRMESNGEFDYYCN